MGWLFLHGATRKSLIESRTKDWGRTTDDAIKVTTTCLASCYRGGSFSGVLWAVWERKFHRDDIETEPSQRWITCDLLRYERETGWGYKDLDEAMGPLSYSCPLSYLELVPLDRYGGNAEWRESVKSFHARQKEKRRKKVAV